MTAKKKTPHVLQDQVQLESITKRVKRANGQMGAIVRMLEEGRSCEDIVTQMAAVAKAVNTAAFTLISASLKECLVDPDTDTDDIVPRLQKLFLSLA
jgi:DNA-binding FrmR family transcriptional regulator